MPNHTNERRFALDFGQLVLRDLVSGNDPVVTAWTVLQVPEGWQIDVFLHSPLRHHGLIVALSATVPAFDADLGMDIETYAIITSAGILESFDCDTPRTNPRMQYRAPAG
ncbi:hypothetical protein CH289_10415 [Rhodococcus sp. RS1C4]|nr:hypothetical protein CH289_10415 [Rhodococcus sp. RS1C4]OZC87450.1 hypothetical protein CH282_09855 [Rhodococcus sp. 06-418-1B]OZD12466.1 hypothetical protein CH253_27710 [Rhodococcus sp. 06-156-3C]OZD13923.1 hypothetical protein CH280_15295 [Rhodococcus sp. 06-156-4C]OZD21091.1 hypothetical protein CH248_12585 [Rhodococcus sp. 06-156-4a]OZD33823.1 hypothetical protein CH284_19650 [Rhodococcus sp. 06-156-3]OZD36316.1 hypothetical protein CH247_04090 [Rhodococcus sp. 06-156-3b]OZF59067.1 h